MVFRSKRRVQPEDEGVPRVVLRVVSRRHFDMLIAEGGDPLNVETTALLVEVAVPDVPQRTVDEVMERVGWVLGATIRTSDVLYRHAPMRYCVLLPATEEDQAEHAAARVSEALEAAKLPVPVDISITLDRSPAAQVESVADR